VLKHAGPTTVRVRLDYTDASSDGLRIEVVDEGPRGPHPSPSSSGHGLVGMRERVALFGGRLKADRHRDGFAVRVELPLPREAR
jgi:signal transduction histidine kinase